MAIQFDFSIWFSIQLLKSNRIVDFNFRNRIAKTFDSIRIESPRFDSISQIDAISLILDLMYKTKDKKKRKKQDSANYIRLQTLDLARIDSNSI